MNGVTVCHDASTGSGMTMHFLSNGFVVNQFQSVVTPNGIIAHMFGPVGRYSSNSFVHSHVHVDLHASV